MILRYFTAILLVCHWTNGQFYSVDMHGSECALILPGGARSSAYDHTVNLFRGTLNNIQHDGKTCITYDAVNAAYLDARKRIHVAQPKGEWKTEEIATVGELLLDVSIQLARTYGLSYEDIEQGLPQIDTSKTLIRDVCPPFLSGVECRPGKYRRVDGLCNNLEHPVWGAAMAPFQRLIGPLYADGINAPRISVTGKELPLSRIVSRTLHPDDGFHDHAGTVFVIAWGQFMDHDFTLTGTPLDPINRNDPEECCKRPLHLKHPYCNEIRVPDDDYFYRLFNIKCIDFVRGFPSPKPGCKLGSRTQFNTLTGVIDGNTIYGVKEQFARKLRTGYGGLLRMNPVFQEYGLKDLLPLKLDIPDEGCTRPNKSMYCFEAGEIRVNEQLVLTCMHTMMARQHNELAKGLSHINPHWDDETTFQESRRINIAIIQHITYNEFLPILLGKEVMEKFGLVLLKDGYWNGYDPKVNPGIIDAFASAAFRFGHSLLPTAVERWSKAHKFIASKRLSDLIRRPYDLYRAGVFDEYLMGLMNQVAQAMDDSITQEVTNHLFKKEGARFGMDLVSFNMQRGREFGVPGYMEFRKFCGLPVSDQWDDMFGSMPNETIRRYQSIFHHPDDIDLWSGGVSERSLPGSMLGPTFACIIATQLSYIRRGDRFWYELPNQPSSFTPEQLQEIRKIKLSRVICDNTDLIDTVQIYPMVLPDHEINPRVPCKSGILPSIDLTKWAEYNPDYTPHQYNLLNEIPDTVSLLDDNNLQNKRRRRRRRRSNRVLIKNNNQDNAEIRVYSDDDDTIIPPQQHRRKNSRSQIKHRKNKPNKKSTSVDSTTYREPLEVADLINDEFFFKQFEKRLPKLAEHKKEQVEVFNVPPSPPSQPSPTATTKFSDTSYLNIDNSNRHHHHPHHQNNHPKINLNRNKQTDDNKEIEFIQDETKKGLIDAQNEYNHNNEFIEKHSRIELRPSTVDVVNEEQISNSKPKVDEFNHPNYDDYDEDNVDVGGDVIYHTTDDDDDNNDHGTIIDQPKPKSGKVEYTKEFDTPTDLFKEIDVLVQKNQKNQLKKNHDNGDVFWSIKYENPHRI